MTFRHSLGPLFNDEDLSTRVFSEFDTNKDSHIDLREYFAGTALFLRGEQSSQLKCMYWGLLEQ